MVPELKEAPEERAVEEQVAQQMAAPKEISVRDIHQRIQKLEGEIKTAPPPTTKADEHARNSVGGDLAEARRDTFFPPERQKAADAIQRAEEKWKECKNIIEDKELIQRLESHLSREDQHSLRDGLNRSFEDVARNNLPRAREKEIRTLENAISAAEGQIERIKPEEPRERGGEVAQAPQAVEQAPEVRGGEEAQRRQQQTEEGRRGEVAQAPQEAVEEQTREREVEQQRTREETAQAPEAVEEQAQAQEETRRREQQTEEERRGGEQAPADVEARREAETTRTQQAPDRTVRAVRRAAGVAEAVRPGAGPAVIEGARRTLGTAARGLRGIAAAGREVEERRDAAIREMRLIRNNLRNILNQRLGRAQMIRGR